MIPTSEEINEYCAMEEVIMIGYPIGLSDSFNHKPIIRRGCTATHLKKDYQGRKEFLVDMACFPGSSGSPVFILNEGSYLYQNSIIIGSRIKLIGILYGGPIYNAHGKIEFYTAGMFTSTNIPTNLGACIKSENILDFENILWKMVK